MCVLILKNFEKLPPESVTSGCLLKGSSGRHCLLHGVLKRYFTCIVRSGVLFDWGERLGFGARVCFILFGSFGSGVVFFLSLLRS